MSCQHGFYVLFDGKDIALSFDNRGSNLNLEEHMRWAGEVMKKAGYSEDEFHFASDVHKVVVIEAKLEGCPSWLKGAGC